MDSRSSLCSTEKPLRVLAHKFHDLQRALVGQRLGVLPHIVYDSGDVDMVQLKQDVEDVVRRREAWGHMVKDVAQVQLPRDWHEAGRGTRVYVSVG